MQVGNRSCFSDRPVFRLFELDLKFVFFNQNIMPVFCVNLTVLSD